MHSNIFVGYLPTNFEAQQTLFFSQTKSSTMIVSNFELLIKRIATVPSSTPSSISTVFRRVVQGYFLAVTNLETTRAIRLFLRITIPTSTGNRIISTSNVQCFFDSGNTDNSSLVINQVTSSNPNVIQYTTASFRLEPQQTGLIVVLPNVVPFISNTNPDLEIRGYIELNQARLAIFPLVETPESDILISPETRGTFLDNDYPSPISTAELDFDQISYGLPTASGKALNTVASIPPFVFPVLDITGNVINSTASLKESLKLSNKNATSEEIDSILDIALLMQKNDSFIKMIEHLDKIEE